MNNPNHQWAHNIVAAWDKGEYPVKYRNAYEIACKVLKIEPKPHPDSIRKAAYRADIDG